MTEIDIPEVVSEVRAAFDAYEIALTTNNVASLNMMFLNDRKTVRYGIAENLYGHDEIAAFRAARPATELERKLERTQITTYGRDMGVAMTLFRRTSGKIGRQSQTWIRTPEGWRILAAHVSVINEV